MIYSPKLLEWDFNNFKKFIGNDLWQSLVACIQSGDAFDSVPGLYERLMDFFADEFPSAAGESHDEWLFDKITHRFDQFIPEATEGA